MIFNEIHRYIPILIKPDNKRIWHEFPSTFVQLVLVTGTELCLKYGLWQKKQLTIKYLAFYKQSTTGNRISRRLRDKRRKHDISPFTTEGRETKYLVFCEEGTKCDTAMLIKRTEQWGRQEQQDSEPPEVVGCADNLFVLICCWPCISIYLFININQLDVLNL